MSTSRTNVNNLKMPRKFTVTGCEFTVKVVNLKLTEHGILLKIFHVTYVIWRNTLITPLFN